MRAILYFLAVSPPCRAVAFTAANVGFKPNIKIVNLQAGDHLTPEYLKLNPQHSVPTLDDDGFILSESRGILTYLASKYGKDDSLYPKDLKKRAIVDQRLYFDATNLYPKLAETYFPGMFRGAPKVLDPEKQKTIQMTLGYVEGYLKGNKYIAGDTETVADHAILTTVLTIQAVGEDLQKYPQVLKWIDSFKNHTGFTENQKGADIIGDVAKKTYKK